MPEAIEDDVPPFPQQRPEKPAMSADLLRRAATRLRESALAATPGPWVAARDDESMMCDLRTEAPTEYGYQKDVFSVHTPDPSWSDIDYCATVHPPVALALADLLDRIYVTPMGMPSVIECAESTARTILREPQGGDR